MAASPSSTTPNADGTVLGGSGTVAAQLTNRGEIVGCYAAGGTIHGFVRDRRGCFTTFDAPGVPFTFARDLNDRGQIVGFTLSDLATLAGARGFLLGRGVTGRSPRSTCPERPGTR